MYETQGKWCKTLLVFLITICLFIFPVGAYSEKETIKEIAIEISEDYEIDSFLILAIIEHESNYQINVSNGNCIGLMQVSTDWHKERADNLGITNWYDIRSNITLGVDYLAELFKEYEDYELVLMLYSTDHDTAFDCYEKNMVEETAQQIIDLAEDLRSEV